MSNRSISQIPKCISLIPTIHHSEQTCAHFCSECSIVGYGPGAPWDLWKCSITSHHLCWCNYIPMRNAHIGSDPWKITSLAMQVGVSWWGHQMETFSALLALYAGNSHATGEFSSQRPVRRIFDVFFDLCPNKPLSKQSRGWWFETPSHPLWRHCNVCTCMGNLRPWSFRDVNWITVGMNIQRYRCEKTNPPITKKPTGCQTTGYRPLSVEYHSHLF